MSIVPVFVSSVLMISGPGEVQREVADHFVQLGVSVKTLALLYGGDGPRLADYVVFYGNPITLRVVINNRTDNGIDLNPDWLRHLSVQITPGLPNVSLTKKSKGRRGGRTTVSPGRVLPAWGGAVAEIQLNATERAVPVGVYRIQVQIPPSMLPSGSGRKTDQLKHWTTVEVREVVSRADRLNFYYHNATWARVAGNQAEARRWLEQLIALAPASPAAHAAMGGVLAAAGKCDAAGSAYEKAIALALAGEFQDEQLRLKPTEVHTWTAAIRAKAADCRSSR
jgi:hypothetical protein